MFDVVATSDCGHISIAEEDAVCPRQKECRPICTSLARGRLMLFDIAGKNAPVAGASRGLGLGAARGFAEAGANLALVSRQMPNAVMEELAGWIWRQADVLSFWLFVPVRNPQAGGRHLWRVGQIDVRIPA